MSMSKPWREIKRKSTCSSGGIPLLQHTSILEGLQKQLAIAQEEIHRLTIAFSNSLDMLQEDERWQQEALTLLEQLVKALQRTPYLLAA